MTIIYHYGTFRTDETLTEGDDVKLQIDAEKRTLYARLHSAGHMLDYAMLNAGYKFVIHKGFHFPSGPYVEFKGNIPADERNDAKQRIQAAMDKLVEMNLPVQKFVTNGARAIAFGDLPKDENDKTAWWHHCGGTHVNSTGEVGKSFRIKKLKKKGKNFRLSYVV